MGKHIDFQERAWNDYLYWLSQDKKTLKKINELIRNIIRNGYEGIGKPNCRMAYNRTGAELPT